MTVNEVLAMGWLPTLPEGFETALGRYALLAAFAGSAVGAVLWLAGAPVSRSAVTLLAGGGGAGGGAGPPGRGGRGGGGGCRRIRWWGCRCWWWWARPPCA